uniref:Cytochrome c biogenesis protein transmembrane region n=2 Tax=Gracilariopsis TaxID=2781 RepID=A0A1C9CF05_9FLOR|nr:thiol:disulfide interchange protein [Gracilariopsis lemaneiformis]YP_009294728.1 cytochrome c biogenesis protein transmembrane region [Gracilariopsis chorda]AJO68533.1 thiol:disulfide interchange protein [Gracilariopsis lemaneiformis]AML79802.1 thiol:disulfide interchange protein [Gracilariopsis lemaneiformis]AOM66988.1 cytochrome c biogenesis protein transmembrane region [Gracilariopsis chorda]UAD88750.1 thiol:disulfide interchange protein [Gracilariopsis chorda]
MINYELINLLDSKIYYLEQKLYLLLSLELNKANPVIFIILIVTGLLTGFNPCLLSIIPVSLSYIYGKKLTNEKKSIFLLGIMSSNIITLLSFHLIHNSYKELINIFPLVSSITIIFISLNLLQIFNLNNKFITIKTNYLFNNLLSISRLYYYSTGIIVGISSSSCTAPILLLILFWISYCQSWLWATLYIFIYLFSYTLPVYLIINFSFNYSYMNRWTNIWENIILLSGSIMLASSIFSLLNNIFL